MVEARERLMRLDDMPDTFKVQIFFCMQQILTDLHLPRTPSLAEMKTRIIFELRHNEELRGKEDTIV